MKTMVSFWCLSVFFILFLISNSFAEPEKEKGWYVFDIPTAHQDGGIRTIVLCPNNSARMQSDGSNESPQISINCKGQVGPPLKPVGILHQIEDVESVTNSNKKIKKAEDRLWNDQINPELTKMKKDLKKEIMDELKSEIQNAIQRGK